ncbi:hypothetical protein HK102_004887 [Quaeritorhiza haematococci]|nr:hypothetical protein HK102_004887 [Quaeritorhiza haematococci]
MLPTTKKIPKKAPDGPPSHATDAGSSNRLDTTKRSHGINKLPDSMKIAGAPTSSSDAKDAGSSKIPEMPRKTPGNVTPPELKDAAISNAPDATRRSLVGVLRRGTAIMDAGPVSATPASKQVTGLNVPDTTARLKRTLGLRQVGGEARRGGVGLVDATPAASRQSFAPGAGGLAGARGNTEFKLNRELERWKELYERLKLDHEREKANDEDRHQKLDAQLKDCLREKSALQSAIKISEKQREELSRKENILKQSLAKSERTASNLQVNFARVAMLQKRANELEKHNNKMKNTMDKSHDSTNDKLSKIRQELTAQINKLQEDLNGEKTVHVEAVANLEEAYQIAMRQKNELEIIVEQQASEHEMAKLQWQEEIDAMQQTLESLNDSFSVDKAKLQSELESSRAALQQALASYEEETLSFNAERELLQTTLAECKARLHAMVEAKGRLEKEVERLHDQQIELEKEEIGKMREQLDALQMKCSELELSIDSLQKEKATSEKQHEKECESMQHIIANLEAQLQAVMAIREQQETELYDLRGQIEVARVETANASTSLKNAEQRIESKAKDSAQALALFQLFAATQLDKLGDLMTNVDAMVLSYGERMDTIDTQIAEYVENTHTAIHSLEVEKHRIAHQLEESESLHARQAEAYAKEKAALSATIQNVVDELVDARRHNDMKEIQIKNLQGQNKELSTVIERTRNEYADFQRQAAAKQQELSAKHEAEKSHLEENLIETRDKLQTLEKLHEMVVEAKAELQELLENAEEERAEESRTAEKLKQDLEAEITRLESELMVMNTTCETQTRELADERTKSADLELALDKASDSISTITLENVQLQAMVEKLQKELSAVRNGLSDSQTRVEDLTALCEEQNNEIERRQAKEKQLVESMGEKDMEIDVLNARISEMDETIQHDQERIGELTRFAQLKEGEVAIQEAEFTRMQEEKRQCEVAIERLDVELNRMDQEKTQSEEVIKSLKESVHRLEEEVVSLSNLVEEKESEIAGLRGNISDLRGELSNLVEEKDSEIAGLRGNISDLRGDFSNLVEEKESEVAGLRDQISALEEEKVAYEARITELQDKYQEDMAAKESRIAELDNSVRELSEYLQSKQEQLDHVQAVLEKEQLEVSRLTQLLDTTRNDYEVQKHEDEDRISSLEKRTEVLHALASEVVSDVERHVQTILQMAECDGQITPRHWDGRLEVPPVTCEDSASHQETAATCNARLIEVQNTVARLIDESRSKDAAHEELEATLHDVTAQLESERTAHASTTSSKDAEIGLLDKKLRSASSEIGQMEIVIKDEQAKSQELLQLLEQASGTCAQQQARAEDLAGQLEKLNVLVDEKSEENGRLVEIVEKKGEEVRDLQNTIKVHLSNIEEMTRAFEGQQQENIRLSNKLRKTEASLADVEKERDSQAVRIGDLEKEISNLEKTLEDTRASFVTLTDETQFKNTIIEDLTSSVERHQKDVEALKEQVDLMERIEAEAQDSISTLTAENEHLRGQTETLTSGFEILRNQNALLRDSLDSLETEMERARTQMETQRQQFHAEIENLNDTLRAERDLMDDINAESRQKDMMLEMKDQEMAKLKGDFQQERDMLADQTNQLRKAYDLHVETLEGTKVKIEQALEDERGRHAEMSKTWESRIESLEQERTQLRQQNAETVSGLKHKLEQKDAEISVLHAHVQAREGAFAQEIQARDTHANFMEAKVEELVRELESKQDDRKKVEKMSGEIQRLKKEVNGLTARKNEAEKTWATKYQSLVAEKKGAELKVEEWFTRANEYQTEVERLQKMLEDELRQRRELEEKWELKLQLATHQEALSNSELKKAIELNGDLLGHNNARQKIKHIAQLKDENVKLKKDNLAIAKIRDDLRKKLINVERELEAYKSVGGGGAVRKSRVSRVVLGQPGSRLTQGGATFGAGASDTSFTIDWHLPEQSLKEQRLVDEEDKENSGDGGDAAAALA